MMLNTTKRDEMESRGVRVGTRQSGRREGENAGGQGGHSRQDRVRQ